MLVEYLAKEWGVFVIPCSSFGVKNYLRISYGNTTPEVCKISSKRLKNGLDAILEGKIHSWIDKLEK